MNSVVYLGAEISTDGSNDKDVQIRILTGTKASDGLKTIFNAIEVSRPTKIKLYKTVLEPVVLFGSETWALTSKQMEK